MDLKFLEKGFEMVENGLQTVVTTASQRPRKARIASKVEALEPRRSGSSYGATPIRWTTRPLSWSRLWRSSVSSNPPWHRRSSTWKRKPRGSGPQADAAKKRRDHSKAPGTTASKPTRTSAATPRTRSTVLARLLLALGPRMPVLAPLLPGTSVADTTPPRPTCRY